MGKTLPLVIALVVCAGLPRPLAAQSSRPLADASLEELLGIRVSSVGRKDQKLTETAAAVYVVSREDILRSGATSIPEVLRMVPGLQVARVDANKWAISARGFNGHFANKMLVLIDGRSIYSTLYSGVFWEQYDLMLQDVERIEVVRGPGATMWGANAVNGVINVITRKARDTQGTMLVAGAGNEDLVDTALRHGGKVGEKIHYRLFSKFFNRNHASLSDGSGAGDRWHQLRSGGRMDAELSERDSLSFSGDIYQGRMGTVGYEDMPLNSPDRLFQSRLSVSGGFGMGRWTRTLSEDSEFSLQAYVNQEQRQEFFGGALFRTVDFDFQHRRGLNKRNDLLWGAGYRQTNDRFDWLGAGIAFVPAHRGIGLWSAFIQDDLTVVEDRLVATLGTKFLYQDGSGFEVQPTARLLWTPSKRDGLWVSVSRAVRTPARINQDLRLPFRIGVINGIPFEGLLSGSPDFMSETVRAFEGGYRRQLGRTVSLDFALFRNGYGRLAGYRPGAAEIRFDPAPRGIVPYHLGNTNSAASYGGEAAASWTPVKRWKLQTNYSWIRLNYRSAEAPAQAFSTRQAGDPPRHTVQLASALDLPRRFAWDTQMFRVGNLAALGVPAYNRLDSILRWNFSEAYSLALGGRNLLDPRHPEFVPEDFVRPSEVRRSFFVQLIRRF